MLTVRNKEKLFNVIIYFLNNTKKCHKLKLIKLLYFLDFEHYRQTGKSVTGLEYYAWEKGPVAKEVYDGIDAPNKLEGLSNYITSFKEEFEDGSGHKMVIKPKKNFDPKLFSKRELKLLSETAEKFFEATGDQMKDASHFINHPWDKTIKEKKLFAKIDFDLVLDSQKDSISKEKLTENKELRKGMQLFLNSL